MSAARKSDLEVSAQDVVVTRVFDAPVELVYEAWTRPEHVARWWVPKGFKPPEILELDVRVGGKWRVHMPMLDGTHCTAYGVYREIVPNERIAWDDFCDDKDGKYFHKAFVTVSFEELGPRKTRVTVRGRLEGVPGRDPMWTMAFMEEGWSGGWNDNLENLVAVLPTMDPIASREIVIVRSYDAPRELVWKVWTDPKHIDRWWGPNGFTNETHSMDVRPGGKWRYTMHAADGTDFPNLITYLVVEKPARLEYDHGEDDANPRQFRGSATFEAEGKGTKLTLRLVFATARERDVTVEKYGAIEGGNQTLDRLGEYLRQAG